MSNIDARRPTLDYAAMGWGDVGTLTPNTDAERAAAARVLARHGALDLAAALGLVGE